jgi:hypothetical protein
MTWQISPDTMILILNPAQSYKVLRVRQQQTEEHLPSNDGVPSTLSPSGVSLKLLSCKVTISPNNKAHQKMGTSLTDTHLLLNKTEDTTYFPINCGQLRYYYEYFKTLRGGHQGA